MLTLPHIDHGKEFDWWLSSKDYARYRDIYPDEYYGTITGLGLCLQGQAILDLGTGTGVLPRNMYKYGARWTGTDISGNQIDEAKRLAAESNMDIDFFAAPAENTGLPDDIYDVVTAAQCFQYFDKAKVLPEIARMLRPNGRFLTLFMAWLPHESGIAAKSEELVLKYNPAWNSNGMERDALAEPEWSREHFTCMNLITYAVPVKFTPDSWHGRILACRGIGASSLSKEQIAEWSKEHIAYMDTLPESFDIPHWVSIMDFMVKK